MKNILTAVAAATILVLLCATIGLSQTAAQTQPVKTGQGNSTDWRNGLVPCGNTGGTGTSSDAVDCDFNDLVIMGQRLVNFLFFASILLTVVLLVRTGFEYVTAGSNTGQLAKAKGRFLTIGIGFLLVLGAWSIINLAVNVLLDPASGIMNPLK